LAYTLLFLVSVSCSAKASDQSYEVFKRSKQNASSSASHLHQTSLNRETGELVEKQVTWVGGHEPTTHTAHTANTQVDLAPNFQHLSLNSKPHPELFHLYIRSDEESDYQLVKASGAQTLKFVRLYGPTKEGSVNYTTISQPHLTKETLTHPRTNDVYPGGESRPTKKSSSYPEGCNTYHYTFPSGEEIRFDRGHGTAHADTNHHAGLVSTKDPENFVPQNQIYNSPIRRDLEERLRAEGLVYKELSIYHRECQYPVRAQVKSQSKHFKIPIPEGFIFLALNKESEIKEAYYFPNFVDYKKIFTGQSGTQCAYFSNLYKITDLTEWFWNPGVTIGDIDGHLKQVDLAQTLVSKLLLFAPKFFQHLTEQQMPPKARVALLVTLLEWNAQAAATLEFIGLQQQINLVHFYTVPRILHELDDRYDEEKNLLIKTLLASSSLSEEAKKVVKFLSINASFSILQSTLQQVTTLADKIKNINPAYWSNAQMYLDPNLPGFYEQFAAYQQDLKKIKIGEHEVIFSLSRLDPVNDLNVLNKLIGGYNISDLSKARSVLTLVEARALRFGTTIKEKLNFLRLFQDADRLPDLAKKAFWEKALHEQAGDGSRTSLLEKRQLADFYGTRKLNDIKKQWLTQLVSHLEREPTRENFNLIASWCQLTTGAFLQNMKEAQESLILRPSTHVALLILRGLASSPVEYEEVKIKELEVGLDQSMGYKLFLQGELSIDELLGPLISGSNPTAETLIRIAKLFQTQQKELTKTKGQPMASNLQIVTKASSSTAARNATTSTTSTELNSQ